MPIYANFVGGPLDGQTQGFNSDVLLKWYILTFLPLSANVNNWPNIQELQYELIAGIYYFVSDTEAAKLWKSEQSEE